MSTTAFQRPSAPLSAVDLFAGAGGLSVGLEQAGFSVIASADHDPDACTTYAANFPDTAVVCGDLADRRVRQQLIGAIRTRAAELDLLAGGPPCQGFSQMRNHDRLLADPRNRLYRYFVELLAELRPRALLVENVPGLSQMAGGEVRRQIAEDLSLNGLYEVRSAVLDAGDFGTPQSRPRLIFVGTRCDGPPPALPEGTGITQSLSLRASSRSGRRRYQLVGSERYPQLASALANPDDLTAVTVEQALSDLVRPGARYSSVPRSAYQALMRQDTEAPSDHVPSQIREDTVLRLRNIPPGGNVYDLPEELLQRYVTGKKWGPAGNGRRLARKHFYAYRRLHPRWLAWTANTKADFAYHYRQPRGLSVRELARLQGFPDRFEVRTAQPGTPGQLYGGARHSRYRQLGNAVPPPLASALGRELAGALTTVPRLARAA